MKATDCEHGNPWDECGECAIAAAEERGRRSGVEEALRALTEKYEHSDLDHDPSECIACHDLETVRALLAPRVSAPECDCDSPLFQGSHLASCPKMQPRDSGKEG